MGRITVLSLLVLVAYVVALGLLAEVLELSTLVLSGAVVVLATLAAIAVYFIWRRGS
jgi:hypothetical protein